jgi:hypothetical protein
MCNHSFSSAVQVSIAFYKTILSGSAEVYVQLSLMAVLIDKLCQFWKMRDLWIIHVW